MAPNKATKIEEALVELDKQISPVLVVNNTKLRPYIESFVYAPENSFQEALGSVIGFFEVHEYSEDSAYIVNFLASVLKKEYYSNSRRPVSESLDAALHKVNVALSELVKHGNTTWLGQLDGAVCVLEKNSLHFSVAGHAQILLSRKNIFTNISEGIASEAAAEHPLKTFVNVSSGRLEENDKLLITSPDLFKLLTPSQVKKNIERMDPAKFIQFLKTAFSNELEFAVTTVIDVIKPAEKNSAKISLSEDFHEQIETPTIENVFSGQTFHKKKKVPPQKEPPLGKIAGFTIEEALEQAKNPEAYTDDKTGHIYVLGENEPHIEDTRLALLSLAAKEKISDLSNTGKTMLRRSGKQISKQLANFKAKRAAARAEKTRLATEARHLAEAEKQLAAEKLAKEQAAAIKQAEAAQKLAANQVEQAARLQIETENLAAKKAAPVKPIATEPEFQAAVSPPKSALFVKIEQARAELAQEKQVPVQPDAANSNRADIASFYQKSNEKNLAKLSKLGLWEKIEKETLGVEETIHNFFNRRKTAKFELKLAKEKGADEQKLSKKSFLPNTHRARELFRELSSKQKVLAIACILLILILPAFFSKSAPSKSTPAIEQSAVALPTPQQILSREKNITFAEKYVPVLSQNDLVGLQLFEDRIYAINKQTITEISTDGNKQYTLPPEAGQAQKITYMSDLKLLFIFTDQNKLLSFSPVSKQFKDNSIELPTTQPPFLLGTFMTYLYVLDSANNQILRYPRAEGGFGAKTSWLKEALDLKTTTGLAMDENIYLTDGAKISKLFKGQSEATNFETSSTPFKFNYLNTSPEQASLAALDASNARVVLFAKSGEIQKQIHFEKLANATAITVDEKNQKLYFLTANEIGEISL